jgi:hypothetical protein
MIKHGVPQGPILGPFLFIIYINGLPPTISTLSEAIIFAHDASVIIASKKFDNFHTRLNIVLSQMNKWFSPNKLVLNLDKTNIIIFIINNLPQHTSSICYTEKYVKQSVNTKFLDLQIDNCLTGKITSINWFPS